MKMRKLLVALSLVVIGFCAFRNGALSQQTNGGAKSTAKASAVPVNSTMHDFMEAIFQGSYRRLKPAIAAAPKNNAGWKIVQSEAMLLAEGGNSLLLRAPKEDGDKWNELTVAARDAGAELFKFAKAKDFANARKTYESMIDRCNACHKQFDDGKNQLEK